MKTGYWNGEPTANYEGISYEVSAVEKPPLHWQNAFVGTRRQGLRITFQDQTWIIDNEHGDGHYKLNEGKGMWTAGHKSVVDPKNIMPLDDCEIRQLDALGRRTMLKEEVTYDEWASKAHPTEFARLQALRASAPKMPKL